MFDTITDKSEPVFIDVFDFSHTGHRTNPSTCCVPTSLFGLGEDAGRIKHPKDTMRTTGVGSVWGHQQTHFLPIEFVYNNFYLMCIDL